MFNVCRLFRFCCVATQALSHLSRTCFGKFSMTVQRDRTLNYTLKLKAHTAQHIDGRSRRQVIAVYNNAVVIRAVGIAIGFVFGA